MTARKLPRNLVEKVWGVDLLPAPFPRASKKIGEVHFEPPPEMPQLLVKHIFTSERLSIQVHPNDEQAKAADHGCRGKSECWAITSAVAGASIGLGFDRSIDAATMREAALDGSIVDMMTWHEVEPGDFFDVPANTVHAIGPGIGLVEIQQNSDLTYRLFDYGRPRELHLEEGIAAALGSPYPASLGTRLPEHGCRQLIDGPHFALWAIAGALDAAASISDEPVLVVPASGGGRINGKRIAFGECAWVDRIESLDVPRGSRFLIACPRA